MKKKSISVILTAAMLCSLIPFSVFAQGINNGQTINGEQMKSIVESAENVDGEDMDSDTADDLQEALNATDGITSANCTEVKKETEAAVQEVFNADYKAEDAEQVTSTEEGGKTYTAEIYEDHDIRTVRAYSSDGMYMSLVKISDGVVTVKSYVFDAKANCFVNRNIKFAYSQTEGKDTSAQTKAIEYGTKTKSAKGGADKNLDSNKTQKGLLECIQRNR